MADGVDTLDAAMELVKLLGVELFIYDREKNPGYARWGGGETFHVCEAMAVDGAIAVELQHREGPTLRRFEIGVEERFGAFLGDSFVLGGAGHAIAANIYEMIEEGTFLNGRTETT